MAALTGHSSRVRRGEQHADLFDDADVSDFHRDALLLTRAGNPLLNQIWWPSRRGGLGCRIGDFRLAFRQTQGAHFAIGESRGVLSGRVRDGHEF